jgi:hypothetical protein
MAKKKPYYIRNLLKMRPKLRKLEAELAAVKTAEASPKVTTKSYRFNFTLQPRQVAAIALIALAVWLAVTDSPILTIETTTTTTWTAPSK